MPARWTLTLALTQTARPPAAAAAPERAVSPGQLHGLAAALLEGAGADHHAQHKPYTISPLLADGPPGHATLRLGWLQDTPRPDLSTLTGQPVRLGAQTFHVTQASEEFTPYPLLAQSPPARRATLRFLSATYFSRSGRWYPLPDPVLLYGSLIRRWNLHAPPFARIDEITEREFLATIALSAHATATQPITLGPGAQRVGFTGHATFTLPGPPTAPLPQLLAALSLFATASGAGAQTTHGLGLIDASLE